MATLSANSHQGNPEKRVEAELERLGFTLVRQGKHLVYRNAEGLTFTRAKTPSDWRAGQKQLHDLRRILGLTKRRFVEGERRERTTKPHLQIQKELPALNAPALHDVHAEIMDRVEGDLLWQAATLGVRTKKEKANVDR